MRCRTSCAERLGGEVWCGTRVPPRAASTHGLFTSAERPRPATPMRSPPRGHRGCHRLFRRTDSLLAQAEAKDPTWPGPSVLRGWLNYRQSRMFESADPDYHETAIRTGLEHAGRALALKARRPRRPRASRHPALLEVAEQPGREHRRVPEALYRCGGRPARRRGPESIAGIGVDHAQPSAAQQAGDG